MLMCVELILMIRGKLDRSSPAPLPQRLPTVYALYLHSHRIAVLMLVILLCESIVMGNAVKILHQHLEFNYTCLINKAPRIISYFG